MDTKLLSSVFLVISVYLWCFSLTEVHSGGGFSVSLIPRDSPLSPLYNPLDTPSQRLRKSFSRSINHLSPSSISQDQVQSEVRPLSGGGAYLMKLSIGTPPMEILGAADTGSDLMWVQCIPCDQCYTQNAPLFDPRKSSTYRDLPCGSKPCLSESGSTCYNDKCEYDVLYGDYSFTRGNLASETFTLESPSGRPVALPSLVFGCGHNNGGTFPKELAGLIGLGGGPLSLISQLSSIINGKFSYCLPRVRNATSIMNFGNLAVVAGEGVVSTPLIIKNPKPYYYLSLESISVGEEYVLFGSSTNPSVDRGNIIIDSGTTLTMLPSNVHSEVESALKRAINLEPTPDPYKFFSLCYATSSDISLPAITSHFEGANVLLQSYNAFALVDGLLCFAMYPTERLFIFGVSSAARAKLDFKLVRVSWYQSDLVESDLVAMAEGPNATDPAQVLAQQVGGPSINPRPLNTRTRLDQLEDKMLALSGIIDQVTTLEERLDGFSDDQAHMGERLVTLEGVVEGNMATLLDQVAELSSKVSRTSRELEVFPLWRESQSLSVSSEDGPECANGIARGPSR
ncbi:hypothetical protein GIB67_041039 [Kingdonia uniflora]|uniref:Peptidase A1 domain-containing protein n=1 Tax=Kingdonia uniflora TaxID=39325 RepID=A0A7J7LG53_9MAGN|nr:hypothetical protein GIB67_041039 [Kingdonia uniflora]